MINHQFDSNRIKASIISHSRTHQKKLATRGFTIFSSIDWPRSNQRTKKKQEKVQKDSHSLNGWRKKISKYIKIQSINK